MKNNSDKFENGKKMIDMRMYDEAEKIFNDLITDVEKIQTAPEKNIWLSKIYNNMGFILYKKVEFNSAQEFYRKSMTLNPSFAPAYYNHGVINYRLGLFESAMKDLEKAVHLEPENSEFIIGLQASEMAVNQKNKLIKCDPIHC